MAKIRARKLYACLTIITCLSITLLLNSSRLKSDELKSPGMLFSAEAMHPQPTQEIQYIVITETPTPTSTPRPTPRPTRTPTLKPLPPSALDEIIDRHANSQSISRDLLKKIAICESHLNTNAVNGIYGGLYQFSASSWHSARTQMNENPDPQLRFNAEEAIKTAAFKLARGARGIWPVCGR